MKIEFIPVFLQSLPHHKNYRNINNIFSKHFLFNINNILFKVGNVAADEKYWGRAEEMDMDRPASKITKDYPGSDIAGEIAASLAAGSMVYADEGNILT